MAEEKEMSFIDHLEELRWHIIRSLGAIMVFAVGAFLMKDFIFHSIILAPSRTDFWTYRMLCNSGVENLCIDKLPFILQSRQMTGQFTMHLTASFLIGIIVAFPYAFWEIWRFVSPALYSEEKTVSKGAVFFVSLLFAIGILFGYYAVAPLSINFLANYQIDPSVLNEFDITSYISTLSMLVLTCGLMFQLPVVVYFLTKTGVATPQAMREYRKLAIVIILVASAVLTPPDLMSQILISVPLMLLYEISIYVSAFILKKQRRLEAQALKRLEERERAYEVQKENEEDDENKHLPLDQRF